jgi:hypothetical protein
MKDIYALSILVHLQGVIKSSTFVQVISILPCEINILTLFFFATVFMGTKTVKFTYHTEVIAKKVRKVVYELTFSCLTRS